MNKSIYIREEFLEKIGVSEASLAEWEKNKLIKPVGFTDDQIPFYTDYTLEQVSQILKLQELGYEPAEIQKIIRKVGLPKSAGKRAERTELDRYLTVGNLAEAVGVSPRTIKHWEDKGIIEPDMRSEGGFRLYSKNYIYPCHLIKDLQLFGYTLEQIKVISDYIRDFFTIQNDIENYPKAELSQKLDLMLSEIQELLEKMNLFKEGIQRWDDLLKKKRREILTLRIQNQRRPDTQKGDVNE